MRIKSFYLTIVLILLPGFLLAMGMGEIKIRSFLNQPFDAEIPLLEVGNTPLTNIKARLASLEDFERVGLERNEILSFITFQVTKNKKGEPIILMTSQERITEPYLMLLVDLVWSNGQLYRSYTILLDPPDYQIGNFGNLKTIPSGSQHSFNQPGVVNRPVTTQIMEQPVTGNYQRAEATYGPTIANESIWQIAQRYLTPDTTLPQVILAIVGTNSEAFTQGNLNGLKSGEKLRIPSNEEVMKIPADLAKQEVDAHDLAWKTNTEIQHALLPPYINGKPGISQFHADNDNKITVNNTGSTLAVPVLEAEPTIDISLSFIPSVPPLEKKISLVKIPVSYLPSLGSLQSIQLEKETVLAALMAVQAENAALKHQSSDLQNKNTELQKAVDAGGKLVQSLQKQLATLLAERDKPVTPVVTAARSYPVYYYLVLMGIGFLGLALFYRWRKARLEEEAEELAAVEAEPDIYQAEEATPEIYQAAESIPPVEEPPMEHSQAVAEPPPVEDKPMPAEHSPVIENSAPITEPPQTIEPEDAVAPEVSKPAEPAPVSKLEFTKPSEVLSNAEPELIKPITPPPVISSDFSSRVESELSSKLEFTKPIDPLSSSEPELIKPIAPTPAAEPDLIKALEPASAVDLQAPVERTLMPFTDVPEPPEPVSTSNKSTEEYLLDFESDLEKFIAQAPEPLAPTDPVADDHTIEYVQPFEEPLSSEPLLDLEPSPKPKKAKGIKSKAALDTLLSLSKVYIGMKDFATAKESLQEVLNFGDEAQKLEAEKLLGEIP